MPIRSIAFLAYFLGSSALALTLPMVGILCYIVIYHVYPQETWWGIPLESLGLRYSFICAICVLIGTALNLNRLPFGRQAIHPLEIGFILLLLMMVVSGLVGQGMTARSYVALDKMAKVFLFIFIMLRVVNTRDRLWQVTVLFTMMTLYLGHEAKTAPPGAFDRNRLNGIGGPDFRESAGLAIHLFALMPFVTIVLRQKQLWLKVMAALAGCYGVNAILLCRARSAFLAGIITGLFAIWYVPRQHRLWVIVVLIIAAIGGYALSDAWFWERMVTIFSPADERDTSAASRLIIWEGAFNMLGHFPLGVGIGRFPDMIGRHLSEDTKHRPDAHNSYVLCMSELGFHGLVMFVALIALAWITLGQLQHRVRQRVSDPHLFYLFIFANRLAILVYVISGFFVSRFYTEGFWWFIALPVCIARAIDNEVRQEQQEELMLHNALTDMLARPGGSGLVAGLSAGGLSSR